MQIVNDEVDLYTFGDERWRAAILTAAQRQYGIADDGAGSTQCGKRSYAPW